MKKWIGVLIALVLFASRSPSTVLPGAAPGSPDAMVMASVLAPNGGGQIALLGAQDPLLPGMQPPAPAHGPAAHRGKDAPDAARPAPGKTLPGLPAPERAPAVLPEPPCPDEPLPEPPCPEKTLPDPSVEAPIPVKAPAERPRPF